MALTANARPSQVPELIAPYDAQLAFTAAQVVVATGYLNNLNSGIIDFGGANPSSGAGRKEGVWALNITAVDMATTDEVYQFSLVGSNDVAFGNGNVELLAFHDLAALAANRIVPTIMGATPAIPPTGMAGTRISIPFTTLMQRIVYRWVKCYVTLPAAGSSITVSSWLSRCEIKF